MLCVNSDETILNKLNDVVGELLTSHRIAPSPDESDTAQAAQDEPETLAASVAEMTESAVQRAIAQLGIPVERLTPHDRSQLVRTLESKGFFQLRGAVAEVAQQLSISEPTVYRYLQQVRRETESR
ncbi:helix-turn-helix domain-containing protein [Brachybacterium timonense]|uniref:helix-turn-helix domain-containing protein n=1 Tax=Brachybacterium timonense TaxID=2050896 RepID=UPI001FE44F66|nr:helix-turn-helix domain-containing protein [Brachybacterium timonense]